ncbi:hypothetical protein [Nocardia sp. NPDC051750]|uniref:hypothetical protein n=1 Tax=Nocardia sp. NPDC051750 TaxID=3364325 RepID=UPI0037BD5302
MATDTLARLTGVATACYGAAVAVRPALLLTPCGWSDDDPARRVLTRTTGFRDLASGLAIALAPTPSALQMALAGRVAADFSDAAVLAAALRGRPERGKAVLVAAGWGLLCGVSGLLATRER